MRSHYDFFYEKVPQWFTIDLVDSNGNNVYVGVNEKKTWYKGMDIWSDKLLVWLSRGNAFPDGMRSITW